MFSHRRVAKSSQPDVHLIACITSSPRKVIRFLHVSSHACSTAQEATFRRKTKCECTHQERETKRDRQRKRERHIDERGRGTHCDLLPTITSRGPLMRRLTISSLVTKWEIRAQCSNLTWWIRLTSNRANNSLMYSRRTPRDLPIDARNMIPSSSTRHGIRNRENANDTTVHNHAILSTAERSVRRTLFHLRVRQRRTRRPLWAKHSIVR